PLAFRLGFYDQLPHDGFAVDWMLRFIFVGELVTLVACNLISEVVAAVDSGRWHLFTNVEYVRPLLFFG
ncbi:hypothetical protein, partial [Pseudomonas viridiflava]|uniref:hypothetical protein n=1 Tax=Pseudomonas viridiflava TaxID=33069 RepID=UPI0019D2D56C